MLQRPVHGGYPGEVPQRPRLGIFCKECGYPMERREHPYGGDSWFYKCRNGHALYIGK